MKTHLILPLFFISSSVVFGQTITELQIKALNSYVNLVNHLNEQLNGLGPSLSSVYTSIQLRKENDHRTVPAYTCKITVNSYYFNDVEKAKSALGTAADGLNLKIKSITTSFNEIDKSCKELEIYYRLKDYQTDNFKKAVSLIHTLVNQVAQFNNEIESLRVALDKLYSNIQPVNTTNTNQQIAVLMRNYLAFEKSLIDAWTYNINAAVYTGWPSEMMANHIQEADQKIATLKKYTEKINYPESSQFKSFISSAETLQETKKKGIDSNTFQSQQADTYSNNLYNTLINYYNNALVSFFNNFNTMASPHGYRGLDCISIVSLFELRSISKDIDLSVTPYVDVPYAPIKTPLSSTTSMNAGIHTSLTSYLEYINESVRQINNLSHSIFNLNADAARAKGRLVAGEKVILNYRNYNFEPPLSLYLSAINKTKNLPAIDQSSIIGQAETLQSILIEINQWNTVLLDDSNKNQLMQDSLEHVYSILHRYKVLIDVFDEKKERLYNDLRSIYESYKPVNPKSSWVLSGQALQELVDEDYTALREAKKYLTIKTQQKPATDKINRLAREVIVNEFNNLTGIPKLGRYNGKCPYSPYEDLAKYSIQFAEALAITDTNKVDTYNRHPYNKVVRSYNLNLAHNYNKFVELSEIPLLKTASQIELYEVINPTSYKQKINSQNLSARKHEETGTVSTALTSQAVSTTSERVIHDTVYVHSIDTVYMGTFGDEGFSMDGYAINNMVLLLDVSGSMNTPDKLPLLKKSILLLLKTMRQEDQISIVTYSGKAKVALSPISFQEEDKIKKVIEQLKSEGKTDGNAGLKLAYEVADKNYIRGGNNRIILATDGEFPIGNKSYSMVEKFANDDIMISVFNFGNMNTSKGLEKLAAMGKGNYEFITQSNVDQKLIREAKAKRMK